MENPFEHKTIPVTSITSGVGQDVTPDILCLPIQIANVCFVGEPDADEDWVLVDAGMPNSAERILDEAEQRFGPNRPPKAILLTHGHFDHVGAIVELIEQWDVPVFAHPLEMPFLTGQEDYPPGDPTVDGGLVSEMSPWFPHQGINLDNHVVTLPEDNTVPGMPKWRWVHTPGHTPGHVSFFREQDGALIAGDAFVTVRQESLYKVFTQNKEINGPPKYFTTDWKAARKSVEILHALEPSVAVTGHGLPMSGEELTRSLTKLVQDFDRIALPLHGRYLH